MARFFTYFIKNSFLINLVTIFLIIIGTLCLFSMNRNLVPQWERKRIRISASLLGASPEQVEGLITSPMEEAVSSFAGIEEIESSSSHSQTMITIKIQDDFDETEDLYQKVNNAINNIIQDLPEDTERISVINEKMTFFWFSSVNVLGYNPDDEGHRLWLKDTVNRIKKIPGIVSIRDNSPKPNIYLKLDREALARFGLTLQELQRKIKEKFRILPVGVIDRSGKDVSVEITNNLLDLEDIGALIVNASASGTFVRLKDVAEVAYRNGEVTRRTYTNGQRSERLVLFKDLDTDAIAVKKLVADLFVEINRQAPPGISLRVTGDGPAYIERQLNVLTTNGMLGIAMVILVLFAFLGIKSALMTALGLPLAYFTTFAVLSALGIGIDLISVVGMILIIGIIVDDAIIVSEQYSQYLEKGHPPEKAAYLSIKKTIAPITGTVLTTIVAFMPILASNDALSDRLRAIPWVVMAALGMSWLESFFILPNHLAHFVKKPKTSKQNIFPRIKKQYEKLLNFVLSLRYPLFAIVLIFMGLSLWFAYENIPLRYQMRIGSERIRLLIALKESNDLDETEAKLRPLFDLMKKIDPNRYSYINQNLGRAYINGTRFEGHRYASMSVRFSQTHPNLAEDKAFVEAFLRRELPKIDTTNFELLEIDRRIDGHDEAKDRLLNLRIEGRSTVRLETLLKKAEEHYRDVVGLERVFINPQLSVEKWDFEFNREALSHYDLSFSDVALQLRGYVTEDNIHEFRYLGDNIRVYTYFEDSKKLTFDQLQQIPINIHEGHSIPLRQVGLWKQRETLSNIEHLNLERIINIEVSFDDKITKKEIFKKELEEKTPPLAQHFPSLKFSIVEADEEAEKNKKSVGNMVIIALLLIIFVLALVLGSIVQPFLIASAIPFGLIGVIWAFYLHGQRIDVMAFIGIIGMAGVVVNNSLIMVDTINKLSPSIRALTRPVLLEGVSSRLRPIILTSMTTLSGVFPMAYGLGGDSGFTKPLALALGWGILCATWLTLFLLPCMLEIHRDILILLSRIFRPFARQK